MEPRGFWGTFILLAAVTALPFALLWSLLFSFMMGMDFGEVLRTGIWGGLAFGILFGLTMAFFLRAITISLNFEDRKTFLSKLNVALAEIAYNLDSQAENLFTYKPSFQAGLLSGKISVQMNDNSATIVGPKTHIKKLQKRLQ